MGNDKYILNSTKIHCYGTVDRNSFLQRYLWKNLCCFSSRLYTWLCVAEWDFTSPSFILSFFLSLLPEVCGTHLVPLVCLHIHIKSNWEKKKEETVNMLELCNLPNQKCSFPTEITIIPLRELSHKDIYTSVC